MITWIVTIIIFAIILGNIFLLKQTANMKMPSLKDKLPGNKDQKEKKEDEKQNEE